MKKRVDGWKEMMRQDHEIGNHSTAHACTGDYRFTRALEEFTLEEISQDIDNANHEIEATLGVKPRLTHSGPSSALCARGARSSA